VTKTLARAELLAGQQFAWSERTPLQRGMIDRAELMLAAALHAAVPAARVLREPDLLLTAQAVVIPDLAVFCGPTWSGPDLVIEYRAESTDRLFYGPKRLAYARARVAEVWFVDATKETLTALRLTDALDYPWPATSFGADDRVRSSAIPGLAFTVRDFLQRGNDLHADR
jgi:Uma2 family endonuclease